MRWSRQSRKSEGTIIDNVACEGLAIDDQGFIYVPDGKKHEVRRYQIGDPNGVLVAGGNGRGYRLNQLNSPRHVFVDRNYSVYVLDTSNHRVMKWVKGAREGTVVAGIRGIGFDPYQLFNGAGVFVDPLGTIYVTQVTGSAVKRWCNGAIKGDVIVGVNGGNQKVALTQPRGLTLDQHGNLYVADMGNDRVLRFSIAVS
jgi:hypothetical protein